MSRPGRKPKCKFGIDTCDGIDGGSLFVCNDCVEDAEFDREERAAAAKRRGERGPACEIIEEDLSARKPFDFAGEEPELRRVGGRIGVLVLEFARKYQGIEFHAEELWKWVSWEKPVAPDSPRRILSLLAKHGFLSYIVVDRAQSLYKILEVRQRNDYGRLRNID